MPTEPVARARSLGLDVQLCTIQNHGFRMPRHWHDELQLIVTVHGKGLGFADGKTFELSRGAVLVIPPGIVHTAWSANATTWTFQTLHASPDRLAAAWRDGAVGPSLAAGPQVLTLFTRTLAALFARRAPHAAVGEGAFGKDAVGEDAHGQLARLLAALPTSGRLPPRGPIPERVIAAREALRAGAETQRTVGDIARSLGWSRQHLSRAFHDAFHMPPDPWRQCARVEAVKAALRAGESVGSAALSAGFSNASHFSRQFRGMTGLTARGYAAEVRQARSFGKSPGFARRDA